MIGGRKKIISISADQYKLQNYGVSISDITNAVKSSNINIPAGSIDNGETEYLVRTAGEAAAADKLGNLVIKKSPDNKGTLYLKNTAEINEVFEEKKSFSRFNGIKSVTLRVTKIPGGNSVSIVDEVKKIIGENRSVVSSDVSFKLLNDSTVKIKSSLDVLSNNALIGFILLIICLYFFIGLEMH